ncbi:MAG: hypothetical protein AAGE80_16955 [Pseudomonadota bacterium]
MKWVGLATGVLVGCLLVAIEFSVFAPLMSFNPTVSGVRQSEAPVSAELRQRFLNFTNGRFDDLPMRVDNRMTLSDVTMEGRTISFFFLYKDPNNAASVVRLNGLESALRTKLCTDPRFLVLKVYDAWAAFYVNDIAGVSIERFTIDPARC